VEKRYPDSPRIPLRIALMQFTAGKPYDALKSLDKAYALAKARDEFATLYEVGGQRAMVVYPYLGRYRDALAELERGENLLKTSLDDSTYTPGLVMSRASLEYWAYQDPRQSLATLETIAGASDKRLGGDYYRAKAVFTLLNGDMAGARAIMTAHGDMLKPAQLEMFDLFESAQRGDCVRAAAIARDLPAKKGYMSGSKASIEYVLASCELEAGDYTSAIARLRKSFDAPNVNAEAAAVYGMAWLKMGTAYEKKGEAAEAMNCYRRVLRMLKDGDTDLACVREARERLDRLTAAGTM
jgi:tetratricopeptide (TPR) repeat protein